VRDNLIPERVCQGYKSYVYWVMRTVNACVVDNDVGGLEVPVNYVLAVQKTEAA
jgi:hypothetical protein